MAHEPRDWPTYEQLRARTDAPPGSSWGLFDDSPERGTANFAGPDSVLEALNHVRAGSVFGLDHPLSAFDPSVAARNPPQHSLVSIHSDQRDDILDRFWPQASSHIDGLRHRRHHCYGFFDGVDDESIVAGSPVLGVNRWSEAPIVGRGVLIDVSRYRAAAGAPIDHGAGEALEVRLLDETLARQGAVLARGDIALIHRGWADWYLHDLDDDARAEVCATRRCTGLAQGHDTLAWLWDHGLAVAASDTFALEVLPPKPGSPFGGRTDNGMMHQELIALLGLVIGELWKLDVLAAACAADQVFESLVVVKPLNLTGGVGSPANAVAIR